MSGILLAFAVLIILRLFRIQVSDADRYQRVAATQTMKDVTIEADRGKIFDRNGTVLAMNLITYTIGARYKDIVYPDETFSLLADAFSRTPDYYRKKFKNTETFYYLEKDIPLETAAPLIDLQKGRKIHGKIERKLVGVRLDREVKRHYPFNEAAGQLLGFTGTEDFGLSGIEKSWEDVLSGTSGSSRVMNDKYGQILLSSRNSTTAPKNGQDLTLSLDINYQIILEEELKQAVSKTEAAGSMGIIMNPNTGQILALGSLPSFNPNEYQDFPLINQKIRPITDTYEPGSVFKIIPVSAAIEREIFTPASLINCENGEWKIYDRTLHDHKAAKWSTVQDILVHSSNIGAAKIAENLGNKYLYQQIVKFGIGEINDIEVTGNVHGQVKAPAEWSPITNSQMAMGQSVTTTLLEIASAYSVVANGGLLLRPSILNNRTDPATGKTSSYRPSVIRRVMSRETAETMRGMLEQVVCEGTGKNAYIEGYRVAGKTGTAQKVIDGKYSQKEYYATFVGFFPANNPVLLCAIAVDNPRYGRHEGSVAAAPAVRNVFSRIISSTDFRKLYDWVQEDPALIADGKNTSERAPDADPVPVMAALSQTEETKKVQSTPETVSSAAMVMPDFTGLTPKHASYILGEFDVNVEVHGKKGKIVAQQPLPGQTLQSGATCILYVN